jgi:hypothetical protein
MQDKAVQQTLKTALDKRILNEFSQKILNEERLEQVLHFRSKARKRLAGYSDTTFQCECDDATCHETIALSTEEYLKMHGKTKNFIVIPGHVRMDLEEIVSSFKSYVVVAKFFPHPTTA